MQFHQTAIHLTVNDNFVCNHDYIHFAPKVNQDQQYTEAEESLLDTELEELRRRIQDVSFQFGISREKCFRNYGDNVQISAINSVGCAD